METEREGFWQEKSEYGSQTLAFDVPLIKLTCMAGKSCEGRFSILANGEQEAIGHICVTDYRMECSEKQFKGKNLEVPFVFRANGMESGDTAKGEFLVISNFGEYYLPYEITVQPEQLMGQLGEIRNLFHFANLAMTDWEEALTCFYSERFLTVLSGSGSQYREVYLALLESGKDSPDPSFAMEQFLILIRKKTAITYECPQTNFSFSYENMPDSFKVRLQRNGWGYTALTIQETGGFLKCDKETLTGKEFIEDSAELTISLDKKKLHRGMNTGSVRLVAEGFERSITVTVDASLLHREERRINRQEKELVDVCMRLYLDYRTGRKTKEECGKMVSQVLEYARNAKALLPALFETHLRLLTEQKNGAVWLLKHVKRILEEETVSLPLYSYYLYLTAMTESEEAAWAAEQIDEYVMQYPDALMPYWAKLHKDGLADSEPGLLYRNLKELWEKGCFSPLLYLEAATVALKTPRCFSQMDGFEIRLLSFMDRYGLISEAFTDQLYTAAETVKMYHPALEGILKKYVPKDEEKQTKVMCLLYMRRGYYPKEAAKWLEKGIESDFRITGLHEAYIRALHYDKKVMLSEKVFRYFFYDTALDDAHLAYVYAKLILQNEELKPEYEQRIHSFAIRQLLAGKIDDELAYLYRNVLMPEDMDEKLQEQLLKLAFANEVSIGNKRYRYCVVRHKGLKSRERYPIKEGKSLITLYTDDYTLLFEDENGLCHYEDTGYEVKPLLGYDRIRPLVKDCPKVSFGACFHCCTSVSLERIGSLQELKEAEKTYCVLLDWEELETSYRRETAGKLLNAYIRFGMQEELDGFLVKTELHDFLPKDRPAFVDALCDRGLYQKAYDAACACGCDKIDVKVMARLCQFLIEEKEEEYDPTLLKAAIGVFEKGKYTEITISYLVKWMRGTVKQMRNIWKAASSMEVPALDLAERILKQLLFSGTYTSDRERIFHYYCENGGRKDLIKEYLSMCAREYLVMDEAVEEKFLQKLESMMIDGEDFSLGAGLALLKYNSGRIELLSQEEKELCIGLIEESLGEDIYFTFYKMFESLYPALEVYGEKSYIEYQSPYAKCVTLHYILDRPDMEEGGYCSEDMREIYPGIFQKEFSLFLGERLQYYMTESRGQSEEFVLSGSLEPVGMMENGAHGRTGLLNDIALSVELQDYHTADGLMFEYARKEYVTGRLLRIK
ncbi:MAG: hypothetical protein J1E61_09125 [Lachnospiraceae bacterium]|nr:hypothetical protein [Lachnospiraceae bacterium]